MAVRRFTYSLTTLNLTVCFGILYNIVYSIFNWEQLSAEEGWGVVAVVAIGLITMSAAIVDLILQIIFKNKKTLNLIGILVVLVYLYGIFYA